MNNLLADWLKIVVADPILHARWLNTLSYLENCGARKIAACQHPTKVRREMLKHAAEEFRHAYYLKRQISQLDVPGMEDYTPNSLLGGHQALRYLDRLDVNICRWLNLDQGFCGTSLHASAYHLVTHAIEVRASIIYPLYQEILSQTGSPISMRSIILEEEHHLAEIAAELEHYPQSHTMRIQAVSIENALFHTLLKFFLTLNSGYVMHKLN